MVDLNFLDNILAAKGLVSHGESGYGVVYHQLIIPLVLMADRGVK